MARSTITTLFVAISFTFNTFAFDIIFDNLDLEYNSAQGHAVFNQFHFANSVLDVDLDHQNMNVLYQDGNLSFNGEKNTFTFPDLPQKFSFFDSITELSLLGANLHYADKLVFSAPTLRSNFGNTFVTFDEIKMDCPELGDELLDSCLKKGQIFIKDANIPLGLSQNFAEPFAEAKEYDELAPDEVVADGLGHFKNVGLQIENHHFYASLSFRLLFKVNLRMWGEIYNDKEAKRVHIYLNKAKRGIFPVTRIILFALKKFAPKNVAVEGKNIYIKY